MKKNKSLNLLSVLLITGIFSCSQIPNVENKVTQKNESSEILSSNNLEISPLQNENQEKNQTPIVINTIDNNKIANTILNNDINQISEDLTIGNTFNSDEIRDTLIAYQDMDSVFSESEIINQSDNDQNIQFSNFSVKSVSDLSFGIKKSQNKWALDDKSKNHLSENIERLRKDIKNEQNISNSINKNVMLKKTLVNNNKQKSLDIHKNNQIKCSQEITTDTNDGNTIKNNEIEFKGNGITRVNRANKTYKKSSKKLTKITHNFESKTNKYIQIGVRVISFNNDGGRTESTECTQKFNDGKVRTIQETRTIDRFGKGKGIGFIKIKYPKGKSCNYNLNIDINNSELSSSVKDPSIGTEVKLNKFKDGKANIICNNKTTVIDIDKEVVNPTYPTDTTPLLDPSPSPTVSIVPEPTTTPTEPPLVEVSIEPTIIPSSTATPITQITESPISTPIATPSQSPTATATPKVKDDNGHGNDDGNCDPSNPGKSNPDCIRV